MSKGAIKNRMVRVGWWAARIGRPGVVPSNGASGWPTVARQDETGAQIALRRCIGKNGSMIRVRR